MTWLVAYDISDDDRRQRAAHVLLDYGRRVQGSVYWVDVEDDDLVARMRTRLLSVINEHDDSLWLVPLCAACAAKVEAVGTSPVPELPEYYVI